MPTSAVKIVASAADSNGDGVIQWAEYYFAAKELKVIFEEMDAKRAARRKRAEGKILARKYPRREKNPRRDDDGETPNTFESIVP